MNTQSRSAQRVPVADLPRLAAEALAAGHPQDAERYLRAAFVAGGWRDAAANLGAALEAQQRPQEAIPVYRGALAFAPDDPAVVIRLALALLREGEYREGFSLWERRPIDIGGGLPPGPPKLSLPVWRGGPVDSLLIFPEQGWGDQIMFARYLPILRARGIAVTFVCPPPLLRLFEPLGITLCPAAGRFALPQCDAWAMLGSLPHLLGTARDTVPPPTYLAGGTGGKGIALVTAGNPRHVNDRNRSLPVDVATELARITGGRSVAADDIGAADFEAVRQTVAETELVITVDTAAAHLAGAMGKPCWVLLPYLPDWRWGWANGPSPWYPATRLIRQRSPGDWTGVLAEVRTTLRSPPL